jgi:hypothetical protein
VPGWTPPTTLPTVLGGNVAGSLESVIGALVQLGLVQVAEMPNP